MQASESLGSAGLRVTRQCAGRARRQLFLPTRVLVCITGKPYPPSLRLAPARLRVPAEPCRSVVKETAAISDDRTVDACVMKVIDFWLVARPPVSDDRSVDTGRVGSVVKALGAPGRVS